MKLLAFIYLTIVSLLQLVITIAISAAALVINLLPYIIIFLIADFLLRSCFGNPLDYYQEFSRQYPHKTKVLFVMTTGARVQMETEKGTIAYAKDNAIYIDQAIYDKLLPHCQRELVYHELGHAVLGLDHNTKGRWSYIMRPVMTLDGCYRPGESPITKWAKEELIKSFRR